MENNVLYRKPVSELLNDEYFIPDYQRGYRWTKKHVESLLNDVLEFVDPEDKKKIKGEFYCLQPIVTKKREEGGWELIDGQQRLTTIFLILSIFNQRLIKENRKQLFSLEYESRPKSKSYLESLESIDETTCDGNIDFYHIYHSYAAIKQWVKKHENIVGVFESHFLNKVEVLWYEIKDDTIPVDIFTRLNNGKIALTNSELVKALLLRTENLDNDLVNLQQLKIAQEWDIIENKLQANDFWYFIFNKDKSKKIDIEKYPARIEYILELMANNLISELDIEVDKDNPYDIFSIFQKKLEVDKLKSEDLWLQIKKYFMIFEEWFNDRYFFHIIGYLINEGIPIPDIMKATKDSPTKTKSAFKSALNKMALKVVLGERYNEDEEANIEYLLSTHLDALEYKPNDTKNNKKVCSALLLFNILSLIQNKESNLRFQFSSFKNESWDIEHVRSVKSGEPGRQDEQKPWLNNIYTYLTGETDVTKNISVNFKRDEDKIICKKIKELLMSEKFDQDGFHKLFLEILALYENDEDVENSIDNSIGNLALLDAGTNRSYKNAIFPIKRSRIIGLDKTGTFVPLCTKNVFLKYYSSDIKDMLFWGPDDRKDYMNMIIVTMVNFFTKTEGE